MATRVVLDPEGFAKIDVILDRLNGRMVDEIADDARRRVPVDTGELRSTIKGWHFGQHGRVTVGTDHALPTEFGSGPHIIRSHGPWSLHNRETGEFFGHVVHHPGTPAQPFMRPAAFTKRIPRAGL